MRTVLVVSAAGDAHVRRVAEELRSRNVSPVVFDLADFPRCAQLSLHQTRESGCDARLVYNGQNIQLNSIDAVWWRRPAIPEPSTAIVDRLLCDYVTAEASALLEDAWEAVSVLWFPGLPSAVQRARRKLLQLRLAAELGFLIPDTLGTNAPADLLRFHKKHNGGIIHKPVHQAFARLDPPLHELWSFTEIVSTERMGYYKGIEFCPAIFQTYINKLTELRVTVVGEEVFAAEIFSQNTVRTRHDWRRYDFGSTPHRPHTLPADIADKCIALTKRLQLRYGALDLILTPEHEYVFWEVNPNGQFLWIQELTGLPISEAVADVLSGTTRAR